MQRCAACHREFPVPPGAVCPFPCPHCASLVLGPYCDLEWIGGGGMGDVYRAREPGMGDRIVAVKIPRIDFDCRRAERRFEREIAASGRLQHENVVRAYHRGEQAGRPYLVMEYVAGRKLSELAASEQPLSPRRVACILLGIARGLAHGERMGVVNRDVKPDNVLLAELDETPKILDYGLALIAAVGGEVTHSGAMLGTPNYAAPEQVRDPHGVTIAADIYSLGCTAVFCLTGGPPFRAADAEEVRRLHAEAPRPSVRTLRPEVSEALDALIRSMMAIEPRERPSPHEIIDALQALAPALVDEPGRPQGPREGQRLDVECPGCGTVYHLLPSSAGKPMQCPNKVCGSTFVVPFEGRRAGDGVRAGIVEVAAGADQERGVSGGDHAEGDVVEAEIAGVDVARARPAEAIEAELAGVAADAGAPPGDVTGPTPPQPPPLFPSPAKEAKPRKARAGVPWLAVAILGVLVGGVALLVTRVRWDRLTPNPEARWAEIVELLDEKKWDRVLRETERFEQEFPESPHAGEVPFLCDLCRAGHDVYSPTGDANRGLALLEQTLHRHRDDPAFPAHCDRLYDALSRLVVRLAGQGAATADRALVERAREAHRLLETVGQASGDNRAPDRTGALALAIEHAERAVELASARQAALDRLEPAKDPEANVCPDEVYADVQQALAKYRSLAGDLEQLSGRLDGLDPEAASFVADLYTYYHGLGLRESLDQTRLRLEKAVEDTRADLASAYRAEPGRVRFVPEEAGAGPDASAEEPSGGGQSAMLVVVWGETPGQVRLWNEWNHRRSLAGRAPPPERTEVFFALARGVLHAFDPEGTLLWARRLGLDSHRLPERVDSAPPVRIAVSTEDNTIQALDESTGQLRWKYRVGQDVVAPPTIVPRPASEGFGRYCGLLPTADGEIRALELVLGKPLGRYQVGFPLTVGGAYDPKSGVVFFPADAKRVFAVDPTAVDDARRPACRAVLFTDHASGSLRPEPVVVGGYLVVFEGCGLEKTRLRAFEIHEPGILEPTEAARTDLTLPGWTWFAPCSTPDQIALVTDQAHLGIFGLNLDNPKEGLYRVVPGWEASPPAAGRALVVHADEQRVWIMAGGTLQQLAIDVPGQQVRPLSHQGASPGVTGFPLHRAQTDRFARRLYLATQSPSGGEFLFTAVDCDRGSRLWQRHLGLTPLGDPLVWNDGVLLVDRSGRTLLLRSDSYTAGGEPLPGGADPSHLTLLGNERGSTCLVVPLHDGAELAVSEVDPGRPGENSAWTTRRLPDRLAGRPCLCGDFLAVPCADGQLNCVRWRGDAAGGGPPVSFSTGAEGPVDLAPLSPEAIVMIDGRRLRRLDLRTQDGVTRWAQAGSPFVPEGKAARLAGEPLLVGDRLFVFDTAGTLYCLEAGDPGRRLARWPLGLTVTRGPVLQNGRLVAVVDDRRLVCLAADDSPETQQPLWITEPFAGRIRGMPVLAGDTLLVADNARQLTGIRLADGTRAWSVRLAARVGPAAAAVPCGGGKMLVPLGDGTLQVMLVPSPQRVEVGQ